MDSTDRSDTQGEEDPATAPHRVPPRPRPPTAPQPAPPRAGAGDPGPALELLVHGVGGTTPQLMLDDPCPVRVSGDDTAACYRHRRDVHAEQRDTGGEGAGQGGARQPIEEAYSWSHLTSGDSSRALWLVLLPFMIANLAHWMRPAAPAHHPAQRLYDLVVRLVALSLTVLLAASACEIALDLTAWQCAASARCVADASWLGFLDPAHGGWWSEPGRRLALASAVPLALVGLLWWLSHHTWSAYESASPPPRRPGASRRTPPDERSPLQQDGFWYGRRVVGRLRAAHVTAGLLTPAAALLVAAADDGGRTGRHPVSAVCGWALAAAVVLLAVCAVAVVHRTARCEAQPDTGEEGAPVRVLPFAACGVVALTLVYAAWSRPGWHSTGRLPGSGVFAWLTVVQGVLVLALAVAAAVLRRAGRRAPREPAGPTALRGQAGPATALLACATAGVLTGGAAERVADWLDGRATPNGPGSPFAGPPVVLAWQASTLPVVLLVVVLLAAVALVRVVRVRREVEREVPGLYDPPPHPDAQRTRQIAGVVARAGLTDSAPLLVAVIVCATLLLGAGAVVGAWLTGLAPGEAGAGAPGVVRAAAETAESLGSWLMGAGVLLLLAMGRRAYRDASARRTVGVLWDVGTFWPRAAHPFAPPCYAERAVPDLTWRMATWTETWNGRLVVSGHSQGSVLAAAAVWQLDPVTRDRVALLTYGCPLERLYGRWFPAYFGPALLEGLHRETDAWRNLWRLTDPIGGPVRLAGSDGRAVDRGPLLDPLRYGRTLHHPLPEPILGHGDYQADPVFDEVRAELLERIGATAPPAGKPSGPPRKPAAGAGPQPGGPDGAATPA